ncbi:MAG: aspartate-semialdehyde dehydrogenase [Chlorobi bacterium]|nr:aspartate-semialdehyde dehydrogenase [Chlorobiota bacterium]
MEKIKVGILGATGSVGQKFIELLSGHPWFEIYELAASAKSAGKKYGDAVNWIMNSPLDEKIKNITVKVCEPGLESRLLFSALDSKVAGELETYFAQEGYCVISNARNHRFDPDVPLIIPEVNSEHLELLEKQNFGGGCIVTNPNCSTIGAVTAIKPMDDLFGVEELNVVTMQAVSGGGYPGVPSLDIVGNILPFIPGEEEKMETEPLKILGDFNGEKIIDAKIKISAQCNRVPVIDGHTETAQVKFKKKPRGVNELIDAINNFRGEPQKLNLPGAPERPLIYLDQPNAPQPRIHSGYGNGMSVVVGRLRECGLFDYKFVVLSHNTVRGAAGNTILIAELMKEKGILAKYLK